MAETIFASCSDDTGILVSDLHSGAIVQTYEESAAQANALGLLGSGHVFAVQSKKALWHVWSWGERRPTYRASLPEKMTAMVFTDDSQFCIAGSATGYLYVWQLGTGCLMKCWSAHFREINQVLVSKDNTLLISASADSTVHVYNLGDIFGRREVTPKPMHNWSGHALGVTSVALLPGLGLQQMVASGSLDRTVRLWDIGTGQQVSLFPMTDAVHQLRFDARGAELLCACGNGVLQSFSPSAGPSDSGGTFAGHTGAVLGCDWNLDSTLVVSCGELDKVRIFESRTRQCISQQHATRSSQISSVTVVQRPSQSRPIPSFQGFQRILTPPEEAPAIPTGTLGRRELLTQAMEEACDDGMEAFVGRLAWAEAAGVGALAGSDEASRRVQAAQAAEARWAAAASGLYDVLVKAGLDKPEAVAELVGRGLAADQGIGMPPQTKDVSDSKQVQPAAPSGIPVKKKRKRKRS